MTEDAGVETDEFEDPWQDEIARAGETFGAPEVLAVTAFVLAVGSFLGFGLLNGTLYVNPFVQSANEDNSARVVFGMLLGAAFALVPVVLGWRAYSRLLPEDPHWIGVLARTAVVIGLASVVLRLVIAVVSAAQDGPIGFARL